MTHFLLPDERQQLEKQYRIERDSKKSDRLKAILGVDESQSYADLAKSLRVDETTVRRHIDDYIASKKTRVDQEVSSALRKGLISKENLPRLMCPTWPKLLPWPLSFMA